MRSRKKSLQISLVISVIFMFIGGVSLFYGNYLPKELALFLPIITFIYGFYLNFMLNLAQTKFFSFMNALGEFSGSVISLHKMTELFGDKKLSKALAIKLCALVNQLDNTNPEKFCITHNDLHSLFDIYKNIKIKSDVHKNLFNRVLASLHDITKSREKLEIFGSSYLRRGLNQVYWVLVGLFIIVLLININSLATLLFSIVLIFFILFVSMTIRDIDKLHYGSNGLKHSNLLHVEELLSCKKE